MKTLWELIKSARLELSIAENELASSVVHLWRFWPGRLKHTLLDEQKILSCEICTPCMCVRGKLPTAVWSSFRSWIAMFPCFYLNPGHAAQLSQCRSCESTGLAFFKRLPLAGWDHLKIGQSYFYLKFFTRPLLIVIMFNRAIPQTHHSGKYLVYVSQ